MQKATSGTALSEHWFVRNTGLSGQLQGGSLFFLEQKRLTLVYPDTGLPGHWFIRTLVCPAT